MRITWIIYKYCYVNGNGVHRLTLKWAKATQTNTKNLLQINQQHLVISRVVPIGLQASEWKRVWKTTNVKVETVNVDDAKKWTIQHRQEKFNTKTSGGRWAAKLLPDITRWMVRKFEEVNYYLTQLLSEVEVV